MEYRRLGSTGLRLSALSLGGWINFERKIPEDQAKHIVATAFDRGVNSFDLADAYGRGAAEEWMGSMLEPYPRTDLVIATKVFFPMGDGPNDRGLSRKHILESIDASLRRLGTDYVDLYYCHRPDPDTPIEETARAMDHLVRQGKVLYWGTSQWEPEQIVEACEACARLGLYAPQVEQPEYSLLRRRRVEGSIAPVTAPRGIGLVVWSPLAMGMLTGKYVQGVPDGSRFAREPWSRQAYLTPRNERAVAELASIAADLGCTTAQLALAWALRGRDVTSAIVGATRLEQLEENLGALDVTLDDGALAAIDSVLSEPEGGA